jgi:hypothetical protein
MQKIPVSTNPGGAKVYADGAPVCNAPCVVELSRDQDHILTFRLDGYRQTDVPVKRQYQTMQVLRNSAASGINAAGMMNGSPQSGAANALMNMAYQEESGEAYVLTPTTVTVDLAPMSGTATAKNAQKGSKAQQAVVKGTGAPVMGEDLQKQDSSTVAKEVLATGAAVGAAATPSVTAKTGSSHEHTSESVSPSGTYTKKTTSTSTSVKASVNPAGAALGAIELLDSLTKEKSPEASGETSPKESE